MSYEDDLYLQYRQSRFYQYFSDLVDEIIDLKEKKVRFLFFQTPIAERIKNLSEFEKKRIAEWTFDFNHISDEDCRIIKELYPKDTDISYIKKLYEGSSVYEVEGTRYLADYYSDYVNIIDGSRITYYQPDYYTNSIYFFGQCTARGTGVEDKYTIESILQKKLIDTGITHYRVVNMAIGCGSDLKDDLIRMKKVDFRKGDIVILCTNLEIVPINEFDKNNIRYYDCSVIFSKNHNFGEWFTDSTFHTNFNGNQAIAYYIYSVLNKMNLLQDKSLFLEQKKEIVKSDNYQKIIQGDALDKYIYQLKKYKKKTGINGAVVVNCNPFTKGHQYLIEKASSLVDWLYIFVVEEDKSFFSFKDRFDLVKSGTSHLSNVTVLPSGGFIISALTFPGYFLKEGAGDIVVDSSLDVHIFGEYICKELNIKIRFAGNEPNDYVTNCYNKTMKKILPNYGVEFYEIGRKEAEGQIISASRVRMLLEKRNFSEIEKIVPKTTMEYLLKKYDSNKK